MKGGPELEFIGPRRRTTIRQRLKDRGKWQGKRGPLRMLIEDSGLPEMRFHWRAIAHHQKFRGIAATPTEALDQLRSLYEQITTTRRTV